MIVIGRPLRAGVLSHIAQVITDARANIESVTQLSTEPAASLEMLVRAPDPARLRAALVAAADDTGVDIAVEAAGLRRRAKRLVVLDVDSTLIQDEAIDVLAARAGVADQVGAITEQAMAGALDFADSLRARVALLAGLTGADLVAVRDELRLTPGARTFVRTLRRVGCHVGVVSGGFTLRDRSLRAGAGTRLRRRERARGGRRSGDRQGGRRHPRPRRARRRRCGGSPTSSACRCRRPSPSATAPTTSTCSKRRASGVAFNAKSALRAAADTSVNLPYLDTVLFMLGISGADVAEAAAESNR